MDHKKPNVNDSGLPPEYALRPELEYRIDPSLELPAPPPEYGQRTAAPAATDKKKRRNLRQLLAVPAVILLAFLCWDPLSKAVGPLLPDTSLTEPQSAPAETQAPPAETAAQLTDAPEGSVIFDVRYAVRDSEAVRYDYAVYKPDPEGTSVAGDTPWPILVYAQASDEAGHTARPEYEPDEWMSSRAAAEYVIDAAGLEGPLTLTLTARYTENGEQRQTVMTIPLPEQALPPRTEALLSMDGTGIGSFEARVIPSAADAYPEGLVPTQFWLMMYNEAGESMGGFTDWTDGAMPTVEYDSDGTVRAVYDGPFPLEQIFFDAAQCSARVLLTDPRTGYVYDVESNRIPIPEAAPETWPLRTGEEGKFVLTVYNDTTTFDVDSPVEVPGSPLTVLLAEGILEEDFTEFVLPEPIAPDGYDFTGWVIHVGDPFDFGTETDLFDIYQGDPPVDTLITDQNYAFPISGTLTRADVERVPIGEDGIRYVNVHACWIKQTATDPLLFLDDGMGNVTGYDMDVPLASEGYLYLCRYPEPTRDGFVFDGWYDAEGNRVELLVCYFSFTPMTYDADGSFTGYDWSQRTPITLTAHWRPA